MKKLFLFSLLAAFGLSGCATTQGVVEHDLGNNEALVKLGKQQVQAGDTVYVIKEKCKERMTSSRRNGSGSTTCTQKTIGEATVTRVVSKDEAVIRAQDGVALAEGQIIDREKASE